MFLFLVIDDVIFYLYHAKKYEMGRGMKKFIIVLLCVLACGGAMAYDVMYNTKTRVYHNPSCGSVNNCTNCTRMDSSEAKRLGGRPCGHCGGKK